MAFRDIVLSGAMLLALNSYQYPCHAFTTPPAVSSPSISPIINYSPLSPVSSSPLFMSTTETDQEKETPDYLQKKGYVPKWKKKATLAETLGSTPQEKFLVGAIPITFQQGTGDDATFIQTTANPGDPLKKVAAQAGQYIKYGCGQGECGTCESLCNGKYLRPCVDVVPTDLSPDPTSGEYAPLVIQVKGTKAKVVSSGKFFSVKSFLLGFWNNLLGMVGFVRDRRKARKNWEERMANEDAVKRLTEEKKRKKMEATQAAAQE